MEQVKKELQRVAEQGAELGLSFVEHGGKPYLLIPMFEGFKAAVTLSSLNSKLVLRSCIMEGAEIEGMYGSGTCRHSVINYEGKDGETGEKLDERQVELSGLDDLGAFLTSWHAWREFGNRYAEVFDPQIITQLIEHVPEEKRPQSALRWFEEKNFNDLESILEHAWSRPDEEFYKSMMGRAYYIITRMFGGLYQPVHFKSLIMKNLGKYSGVLEQGLEDEEWGVRHESAHVLAELGVMSARSQLLEELKNDSFYVRDHAFSSLRKLGVNVCEVLLGLVSNKETLERDKYVFAMAELSCKEATESLGSMLLDDEDPKVRRMCATALGNIIHEKNVDFLVQGLRDKDSVVRACCASNIEKNVNQNTSYLWSHELLCGKLKNPFYRNWLVYKVGRRLLRDEDEGVRLFCAKALRQLSGRVLGRVSFLDEREVYPYLIGGLRDVDSDVKLECIYALNQIGNEDSLPFLNELLGDEDFEVGRVAAGVLGLIGRMSAIPLLIEGLRHDDGGVISACAWGLGYDVTRRACSFEIEDAKGQYSSLLKQGLRDQNMFVRAGSMIVLEEFGERVASGRDEVVSFLVDGLKQGDNRMKKACATVLGKLGGEPAIPHLRRLVETKNVHHDIELSNACHHAVSEIKKRAKSLRLRREIRGDSG